MYSQQRSNILTQDGTFTQYNQEYDENYHSLIGAKKEALEKFIYPSGILDFNHPHLLDIGFGLGYNALYTLLESPSIKVISLEKDPTLLSRLGDIHKEAKLIEIVEQLKQKNTYVSTLSSLELIYGDARNSIQQLNKQGVSFSHIFLDAFSPSTNPELWTLEFFKDLYRSLISDGLLITYSSSLAVMRGLQKAGFSIGYTPNIGRKRGGIIAFKNDRKNFSFPISIQDQFLLQYSVRSLPNRDKGFWDKEMIQAYRKKHQEISIRCGFYKPHKQTMKIYQQKGEIHG